MTPTECVSVVEFLAARCPAMRMHENTPEAWYVDLAGYDLTVAMEAVRQCSLNAAFVGLADLIAACQSITRREAGRARVAEIERQIEAETRGDLHPRPVAALNVGQDVPPARMLRQAVSSGRRHEVDTDTAAAAEHEARKEQARQELEAVRAAGGTA